MDQSSEKKGGLGTAVQVVVAALLLVAIVVLAVLPPTTSVPSGEEEKLLANSEAPTLDQALINLAFFAVAGLVVLAIVVVVGGRGIFWRYVKTGSTIFVEKLLSGGGRQAGPGIVIIRWPLEHFAQQAVSGPIEIDIPGFTTQMPRSAFDDLGGEGTVPLTANVTGLFIVTDLPQLVATGANYIDPKQDNVIDSKKFRDFLGRLLRAAVTGAFSSAQCKYTDTIQLGKLTAASANEALEASNLKGIKCQAVLVEDPTPPKQVLEGQAELAASDQKGTGLKRLKETSGWKEENIVAYEAAGRGGLLETLGSIATMFGLKNVPK